MSPTPWSPRGARFVAARARGRRGHDGRRLRPGQRPGRRAHRAPGPGLTNAMTGITEAAKSRTPLIVLAPEATRPRAPTSASTRPALAAGGRRGRRARARGRVRRRATAAAWRRRRVGAAHGRARTAAGRAGRRSARHADRGRSRYGRRRTAAGRATMRRAGRGRCRAAPAGLHRRPGRRAGADGRAALAALADRAARCWRRRPRPKGCSRGDPWDLDVSGGFASPLAAELIAARRPRRRLGLRAEHVDDPARPADRPGRHGRPGRPRPGRARRQPAGRPRRARRRPRATRAGVAELAPDAAGRAPRPSSWRRSRDRRRRCAGATCPMRTTSGDGADRPADAHDRARRPAAGRARRSPSTRATSWATRRMFLSRARRARLLLHPGVPVDRAGPGHRDRRRARPAGPAHRGRARRRRLPDGGRRAGDRRSGCGLPHGDRGLQRRGVRRRGAPLRPGRLPARHRRFPDADIAAIARGLRLRRRHRPEPRPTWRAVAAAGWPGPATGRW